MNSLFSRTALLLGDNSLTKLSQCSVAVFGVGGVGSFVAEGLARAGVGNLILIDNDTIDISNINRQIHATTKTVGQSKVAVMKQRILDINPSADVQVIQDFYLPENAEQFFIKKYDYVVDAIDTVAGKIDLAVQSERRNIPIISSMGAGNKLDPTKFVVADIYDTSVCPLARVMRKELRNRGITKLKVVYSKEQPLTPQNVDNAVKRQTPGSVSFVPSVVGMIVASVVVKDLLGIEIL